MAFRRLWEKIKNKTQAGRQATGPASSITSSIPSRVTPSPTSSRSAPQPIASITAEYSASVSPKTSQLPSLQERLWNEAYDDLRKTEPQVVKAFEKIIAIQLNQNEQDGQLDQAAENRQLPPRKPSPHQMQKLVHEGLDRTAKTASIKQGVGNALQAIQTVKGLMDSAVQFVPQAAVAWAGVCLGIEVLSNPVTEDRDNREGINYVLSRIEWYWNLSLLLLDENEDKDKQSFAGLRSQLEQDIKHIYEKLLLYQLKSICLYRRHWVKTIIKDAFKLDGWADQLSAIKEVEAAVQRDMEQYSTEEIKNQLQTLSKNADTNLKAIISSIQDQTYEQERRSQDDKDKQCLLDLYVTDPHTDKKRIEETKGGLLEGSYSWILEHDDFIRFRNSPQSRLLWIKGDPGKGKTMLLCGILDRIKSNSSDSLSYFFCQATSNKLDNAVSVLRGLIWDLVRQNPSLSKHVRQKYDIAGKDLFIGANAWHDIRDIASAILADSSLNNATIVVDALDECNTDRERLLDFIVNSPSVKWIVSSRNWLDIEAKLGSAKHMNRLHLEINEEAVATAVAYYIQSKVNQLGEAKKYDKETKDAVRTYLTHNANGTFLWVALVCQELADEKVRRRSTISKLKLFPPGLDALYTKMIEKISESDDTEICYEILALMSTVYRPIDVEELRGLNRSIKEFDQDEVQEIIALCGSFLTLRENTIYFVHQSAKDFLLEKATNKILSSGIKDQHFKIFTDSLDLLGNTLRRDIYDLRNPGYPISQVETPSPDPLASIRYSCVYWADHLQNAEDVIQTGLHRQSVVTDTLRFLKTGFLQWLEALSLMHNIPEGVKAIQKLERVLANSASEELQNLAKDARRFLLSQKGGIELAPLQTYTSALIFSPINSLIKKLFYKEFPGWVNSAPKVEADWNACLQTLEGHSGWVRSVAISADGRRLASGSGDRTVKLWDAESGACLQTLEGHSGSVSSVAISADGRRLASGSDDRTVKLWDAESGACLQTLEGHSGSVSSVAISADGRRLASGSDDRTVKLWDAESGACLQTLEGYSGWVRSVAISADGRRLASGSDDRTVKLWDAESGACLQTLEGYSGSVRSVAISADGRRLASGSGDRTVKLWDAESGACLQTLEGHSGSVSSVAISADGRRLASGSDDRTVKLWDAESGACLQTLEGHSGSVSSVAISADGRRLASGSADRTVKLWDAESGACLQTLEGHSGWVTFVAISPDGRRLASGSDDRTVKLWDAESGACLQTLDVGRAVFYLEFDLDHSHRILSDAGEVVFDLSFSDPTILTDVASLSDDGQNGYGISTDHVWIVQNGRNLLWLPPEYRPGESKVAGSIIAIGCNSGRVWVIRFARI
ncbi:hypothetical protein BJ166DRAFT_481863 [Pestalotiopsis sp. NC0098]|nr:hypothetical protein BJ166DRAFT_481863 [Pestalotiopsis sp. NC0098]